MTDINARTRAWRPGSWRGDLRDAWRAVRRTPLQAAVIVAILTAGTTLTVLMLGVVNGMVSGAIPGVIARDRLVHLGVQRQGAADASAMTIGEFRRLPSSVPGLESVAGEIDWRFSAIVKGRAITLEGLFVTGPYFSTLGTVPALGRLIVPSDDRAGAPPVAVIGHALWRREFGSDPGAIGATIRAGTGTYTVVGVLPPRFVGLDEGDFGETTDERGELWLPMREMWAYPNFASARVDAAVGPRMYGRLAGALNREAAEAQAQTILPALAAAADAGGSGPSVQPRGDGSLAFGFGGGRSAARVRLAPLSFMPSSDLLQTTLLVGLLMAVPLVVLAIATINVAGVHLARAVGRTREIAIRMALGASRMAVARAISLEVGYWRCWRARCRGRSPRGRYGSRPTCCRSPSSPTPGCSCSRWRCRSP